MLRSTTDLRLEPTGELAKDYEAYCELDQKGERDEFYDAIKNVEVVDPVTGQTKMRTRVVLRNLDVCLNKNDFAPLADAMLHCVNLDQLLFTGCGVTDFSIKLIAAAVYNSPAINTVAIDFNPNRLFPDPTVGKKEKNDVWVHPAHFRGGQLRAAEIDPKEAAPADPKKGGKPDPKKAPPGKGAQATAASATNVMADIAASIDDKSLNVAVPNGWAGLFLGAIQQLSLRGNGITDKQLEGLCPLLESHGELLSLSLWGNQITSTGAGMIANALKTNRRLTALNLGHNRIDDQGCAALASVFYTMDVTNEEAGKLRGRTLVTLQPPPPFGSVPPTTSASVAVPPALMELPTLPTFNELFNHSAEAAAPTDKKDAKKKEAGKKKGDGGPTERHKGDFDRDCVRLDEGRVRVPGNTSLWAVNLSHNPGVTKKGIAAWMQMLASREPAFTDPAVQQQFDGTTFPSPFVPSSLSLSRLDVAHPNLDKALAEDLGKALAENIEAREALLTTLRGPEVQGK